MAAHSSSLAWEIPWTEQPVGLQSTGLGKVRHGLATIQQILSPLPSPVFYWNDFTVFCHSVRFSYMCHCFLSFLIIFHLNVSVLVHLLLSWYFLESFVQISSMSDVLWFLAYTHCYFFYFFSLVGNLFFLNVYKIFFLFIVMCILSLNLQLDLSDFQSVDLSLHIRKDF